MARGLSLLSAILQDLLRIVVPDSGLVVEHFKIGILQQLRVVFTQKLADGLLNARIAHFTLPSRLAGNHLVNRVADYFLARPEGS